MIKEKIFAGADNATPSIPQYFSWINNTNEGSTEQQTLINLDFFRWMKETYGMQINIYAWDAGNFDGASEGYGNLKGEKFKSQYPDEYNNIVREAEKIGIRMGLWGSPDGFGDTAETEKERFDFYVHLCRDHHFALFKLDGVCGQLREEKAPLFAKMLEECRRYSPDLIVLNHRLNLYEAEKYVTTYLWNGEETYTDVFAHNKKTGMHNRVYAFSRGNVENLDRLAEDHGVCLSSSLDYFEDDLIYQAFGRCLILAPEIYGNPWLLKDDELSKLAYIYNLHRRNADILVNGIRLPDEYGCNAVSRGNENHRFICTGNDEWNSKEIIIKPLECGISSDKKLKVIQRFPYVKYLGEFDKNSEIRIELTPFRACLIEIGADDCINPYIEGKDYEVIIEDCNGVCTEYAEYNHKAPPLFIAPSKAEELDECRLQQLYESAMYAVNNDSLEYRCLQRSGETTISEVKRARDAFFNQKTYLLRGCENRNLFDGNPDSFFDSQSRSYCDGFRIEGGCLRVDFGKVINADYIEMECFSANEKTNEVPLQIIPDFAEYSVNLSEWKNSEKSAIISKIECEQEIVKFRVHTTYMLKGERLIIRYNVSDSLRYLRIAEPMDRIFSIRAFKDGNELSFNNPKANNLMAHYNKKNVKSVKTAELVIPECDDNDYLAVAIEGEHGAEGVYCTAEIAGNLCGFPERAPTWKANVWEHIVCDEEKNNTFFLPIKSEMSGKKIKVYTVFTNENMSDIDVDIYFCKKK